MNTDQRSSRTRWANPRSEHRRRSLHTDCNQPMSTHSECVWKSVLLGADLALSSPRRHAAVHLELQLDVRNSADHGFQLNQRLLRFQPGYSQA